MFQFGCKDNSIFVFFFIFFLLLSGKVDRDFGKPPLKRNGHNPCLPKTARFVAHEVAV